jgi:hypothetical protein
VVVDIDAETRGSRKRFEPAQPRIQTARRVRRPRGPRDGQTGVPGRYVARSWRALAAYSGMSLEDACVQSARARSGSRATPRPSRRCMPSCVWANAFRVLSTLKSAPAAVCWATTPLVVADANFRPEVDFWSGGEQVRTPPREFNTQKYVESGRHSARRPTRDLAEPGHPRERDGDAEPDSSQT